jgi:hypothetical protein
MVLLVSEYDLAILPVSVLLGYLVPSVLMVLPYPEKVTAVTHQYLVAFWQLFPVWTMIIQWALNRGITWLVNRRRAEGAATRPTPVSPSTSYLRAARRIYLGVLICCMLTHLPVLLLFITPSSYLEYISEQLAQHAHPTFASVFIPSIPLPSYRVRNLAEGAHIFLQWDLYIGSAACLLWGVVLHRNAVTEKHIVDPNNALPVYRELLAGEKRRDSDEGSVLLKILGWSLLSGPIGALTVLLWERDEIVKQKIKQGI